MFHTFKFSIGLTVLLVYLHAPSLMAQKIVIAYYSEQGHTKAMAESVAKGASATPGAEVRLLTVEKASEDDLLWADAIIVGSPVHYANVAAPVQEFLSHWPGQQQMKDKVGASFVTGGGISSGEELTQLNILHSMLVYNMIVVGGPTTREPFGASGITNDDPFVDKEGEVRVSPKFLARGEALGKRVAEVAGNLRGGEKQ